MSHGERDESTQNRGRRIDEIRGADAQDLKDGALLFVGDPDADAPTSEGAAEWGEPIWTFPFDYAMFLLDLVEGGGTITSVEIRAQVSEFRNNPTDEVWHDLYIRDPATGDLVLWVVSEAITADANLAWPQDVYPKSMRFKMWVVGGGVGTRAVLRGVLDKKSR